MKISTICFPIREGKIFLAKKKIGISTGFLNGYGGKINKEDQSPEAAAVREIEEESGVKVKISDLEKVGVIRFFEDSNEVLECHIYTFSKWEGEFEESHEMEKPEAFDPVNLPIEKLFPADRKWLPLISAGKRINAESYHTKGFAEEQKFEFRFI